MCTWQFCERRQGLLASKGWRQGPAAPGGCDSFQPPSLGGRAEVHGPRKGGTGGFGVKKSLGIHVLSLLLWSISPGTTGGEPGIAPVHWAHSAVR